MDGGVDHLALCLANLIAKQAATHIFVEYHGQRTSYLERVLDPGFSLEACRRADNGAQEVYEKPLEPGLMAPRDMLKQVDLPTPCSCL